MAKLSLIDIGKHFIIGLSGPTLTQAERELLRKIRPGGIILLERNFPADCSYPEWLESIEYLIREVRILSGQRDLIVAIDHEGGRVHRVPEPLTHFPFASKYASRASEVSRAMLQELRSIGVNFISSPVCDINTNDKNPVIGERAFGENVKDVTSAALEFSKICNQEKFLYCIKHFPGHGDTAKDSHNELPSLDFAEDELLKRELQPFKELINAGAPIVMTSHILFPKIDNKYPATLSNKIITGILRSKLGFDGVVITDDLDMSAITDNFSNEELVANVFNAGCDLLLIDHNPEKAVTLAKAALSNIEKGAIPEDVILKSGERISKLLNEWKPTISFQILEDSVFKKNATLALECSQ